MAHARTHAHALPAWPVNQAPEPEQSFYRNAEVTRWSFPERWGCFVLGKDYTPARPTEEAWAHAAPHGGIPG